MSTAVPETPATPAAQATPTFVAPPAPLPGPPPVAAPPAAAPAPRKEQHEQGKVEDLPEWAQKLINGGRDEAAKSRIESRDKAEQAATTAAETARTEFAKALAKAAGIELPGQEVDPEKLAADLIAREGELRALRTEVALRDAASKHSADLDILLPYLKGKGELEKLDPTSADFAKALDAVVKSAVDSNAKFKASGQAPGASAVPAAGGSGENGRTRVLGLGAAIEASRQATATTT